MRDSEREYEALLRRFRHLLESKTIREYDEVNPRTGEYKKRPIELDEYIKKLEETVTRLRIKNSELIKNK